MKDSNSPAINEKNQAPLEKIFKKFSTPFEQFIHDEAAGGVVLMLCTIAALIIANTNLLDAYQHLLHTHLSISFGELALDKTLHHWINDGLMALFFLLVGLEIKREILDGELSDIKQATLPLAGAVGGMVVPAAIYVALNAGSESINGWAIPMATDIAFAVGVLVLLGARVPTALITFLVALAIVDDLGAVLVIALFYTEEIYLTAILYGVGCVAVLGFFNLLGIRSLLPYLLVGIVLWIALLKSGVHATLAGIITALMIPARNKYDPSVFGRHVRQLMDKFDATHKPGMSLMRNQEQLSVVHTLENGIYMVDPPLQRLEHKLHLPVAFLIMPIFALANAGIPVNVSEMGNALMDPVTLGVVLGLLVGKPLGITGCAWIAIKLGWATLPTGIRLTHLFGVGFLCGIGFTMSIFITELAFVGQAEALLASKMGILFASAIAGIIGFIWLRQSLPAPDTQGK